MKTCRYCGHESRFIYCGDVCRKRHQIVRANERWVDDVQRKAIEKGKKTMRDNRIIRYREIKRRPDEI